MKVYRYLCKQELDEILKGNIKQTGRVYNGTRLPNTHRYKHDVKYLHFFRKLDDLKYIQKYSGGLYGGYVCLFDIPFHILIPRTGKGYYEVYASGYDDDSTTKVIKEYAIESKKMEQQFLVDYVYDKNCNITPGEVEKLIKTHQEEQSGLGEQEF